MPPANALLKKSPEIVDCEPGGEPGLTPEEVRILKKTGLDCTMREPDDDDPIARTEKFLQDILRESLTVQDAARRLGVDPREIETRLSSSPRTLYGIRQGSEWRIPEFQFDGERLLPGFGEVVTQLRPSLHPVAFYRWFTTPSADLQNGDGHPLSPREWLHRGRPPSRVARIAAYLDQL